MEITLFDTSWSDFCLFVHTDIICVLRKKLSNFAHQDWQHAANYVAKSYIKRQPKDTYFDDVQLQMDAKLWGNEFNKKNPPKKVDIIQTYIIEMVDRKDKPVFCVEHLIEGKYIKYNSNSGFVSDNHRRTPQVSPLHIASNSTLLCWILSRVR